MFRGFFKLWFKSRYYTRILFTCIWFLTNTRNYVRAAVASIHWLPPLRGFPLMVKKTSKRSYRSVYTYASSYVHWWFFARAATLCASCSIFSPHSVLAWSTLCTGASKASVSINRILADQPILKGKNYGKMLLIERFIGNGTKVSNSWYLLFDCYVSSRSGSRIRLRMGWKFVNRLGSYAGRSKRVYSRTAKICGEAESATFKVYLLSDSSSWIGTKVLHLSPYPRSGKRYCIFRCYAPLWRILS